MKIEEEIRQSTFKSAHQKALINFIFTSNWLANRQQEFFKPFGITSQQFNILRILKGSHPECLSGTEIKSRMLDKNSDVSRLIDRLIVKKLVEKRSCASDKRASDIYITPEGVSLLETVNLKEREIDLLSKLSEKDAIVLSDLLDKLRS